MLRDRKQNWNHDKSFRNWCHGADQLGAEFPGGNVGIWQAPIDCGLIHKLKVAFPCGDEVEYRKAQKMLKEQIFRLFSPMHHDAILDYFLSVIGKGLHAKVVTV